jgi:hypothetical protein
MAGDKRINSSDGPIAPAPQLSVISLSSDDFQIGSLEAGIGGLPGQIWTKQRKNDFDIIYFYLLFLSSVSLSAASSMWLLRLRGGSPAAEAGQNARAAGMFDCG